MILSVWPSRVPFFFLQTLRSLETIKSSYGEICHESKAKISRRQGSHSSEIFVTWILLLLSSDGLSFEKLVLIGHLEVSQEKSLRHLAMAAKFLDDNKPIKSLKKSVRTISNFTCLIQFHLIWQILLKFSLATYLLLSKFRKRKRQFLCCVHLLHKAGSWN